MKHFFTALLLAFTFTASAQSTAKLDEEYGLMGYKFGTHVDSITGITLVDQMDDEKYFDVDSLVLLQGKVPLKKITLRFYKDRLFAINGTLDKAKYGKETFALLNKLYGKPQKEATTERYGWYGKKAGVTYEEKGTNANIGAFSSTIINQKIEDMRKALEEE